MSQSQLSHSLHALAQALEQLATTLEQQQQHPDVVARDARALMAITQKIKSGAATAAIKKEPDQHIGARHQKDFLKKWLGQKKIMAVSIVNSLRADSYLYNLVDFLADHYHHLEAFYETLKKNQGIKKNFTFKTPSKQSLKYIRQWCSLLQQHEMIDEFTSSETEIFVDINEIHKATQFIYGYWLEILLRLEAGNVMRANIDKISSFDIAGSVHIIKPDGSGSELDLLVMLNQKVYWFECKSGIIQSYYERFKQHRRLLQLPANQSFVVIPSGDGNVAIQTMKRSGMGTLFATDIATQLEEIFLRHN